MIGPHTADDNYALDWFDLIAQLFFHGRVCHRTKRSGLRHRVICEVEIQAVIEQVYHGSVAFAV